MLKQFIKDTGIYGGAGLISRAISILLIPIYTRALSPVDYGTVDIISVITSFVLVSITLQITQAVARFLADSQEKEEARKYNIKLVSSIGLLFTLFTSTVFLLIGVVFSKQWSALIFGSVNKVEIVVFAVFQMFFLTLFYFVQVQLRWRLQSKKYAVLSFSYTLINILLAILFVVVLKYGVIGVFGANIVAAAVSFAIGFYMTKKDYSFIFSKSKLKEMLKYSLPLVPSTLGSQLEMSMQQILVKSIMTLSDLGIYALGRNISLIINFLFQNISLSLIPLVYQNFEKEETPAQCALIFKYSVVAILFIFISVSIFSKEIIIIMSSSAYYSAFVIIPFLILSETFDGMQNFFLGMAIKKRTDIIAYINLTGAVISLGLGYLLINVYGLIGAALARLFTNIAKFGFRYYFSQKFYRVQYDLLKMLYLLITAIVLVLIGILLPKFYIIAYIFTKLVLLGGFIIATVFLFKVININEIKRFFKMIVNRKAV